MFAKFRRQAGLSLSLLIGLALAPVGRTAIDVGALQHDGPATPEQLSLLIPITGPTDADTTASVRYREQGTADWVTGHPLFRIQPSTSNVPRVGEVIDAFAWPIIDLRPGRTYEVEVTLDDGNQQVVRTATMSTRSLPAPAGAATIPINPSMSFGDIQAAFDGASAGDVIEFEDGTYELTDRLRLRGATDEADIEGFNATDDNPIYVRGESRSGVVLVDGAGGTSGGILRIERHVNQLVIENLTIRGTGMDESGGRAVFASDGNSNRGGDSYRNITVRNLTVTGVDRAVQFIIEAQGVLVYDNTFIGNNLWNSTFVDSNLTWTDDGINVPGSGNAIFNNTLRGFGDSLSVANHSGNDTNTFSAGVHIYRNDARNSGDDFFEADHGHRNMSFYDNRSHNSMTFLSLDPLYGGPLLVARNVAVNIGRQPHKWNDQNSGHFVYNNTWVTTTNSGGVAGWIQFNNGPSEYYGVRNNILIWYGVGDDTLRIENLGHTNVDFSHNCWYPDGRVQFGNVFSSFADAEQNIASTTPVFGGLDTRFANHSICAEDPFTVDVVLGTDYLTEVTATYWPELRTGSGANNNGIAIPNITDGHSGSAPDRGAAIGGIAMPALGDRSASGTRPRPPTNLRVN
ncbi:MAG: hypothetical protein AAFX85_02810 [Pseudomonadota bacterium]